MAKPAAVTPEEAQANADAIRRFWRDGRRSLSCLEKLGRKEPAALQYGRKEGTFAAEAKRLGTYIARAAYMRKTAQEYTAEQIEDLCALVVRHRSCFGPSSLSALLAVENRKRRDKLMRQAVRERWTTSQVRRAAQASHRRRRPYVGRKQHVPSDPAARLLTLDALAEKWLRWCSDPRLDWTGELRRRIDKTARAVDRVRDAVAEELRRLDADQK
jgi:hypothetical protein